MRIDEIRIDEAGGFRRLAGQVTWEDNPLPPQPVWIAVRVEHGAALNVDGHAFLTGALLPAMARGERRLAIQAAVDPELREGLVAVMRLMASWYGSAWRLLRIEAADGSVSPPVGRDRERETASFLSGGTDSTALLLDNHARYPNGHPKRIRAAVAVNGFAGATSERHRRLGARFEDLLETIAPLPRTHAIPLVPVDSNLRTLAEDLPAAFWEQYGHGAGLAAVAHALGARLDRLLIAGTFEFSILESWGSHPLLDANFSSSTVRLQHEGAHLGRFAKTRIVASSPVAVDTFVVCIRRHRGGQNCGRCYKCLRAMVSFIALGVLERSSAFPQRDVDPRRILRTEVPLDGSVELWRELIEPLREAGRHDLADAIVRRLGLHRGRRGRPPLGMWARTGAVARRLARMGDLASVTPAARG